MVTPTAFLPQPDTSDAVRSVRLPTHFRRRRKRHGEASLRSRA